MIRPYLLLFLSGYSSAMLFGVCPITSPCHCESTVHIKCNSRRLKRLPYLLEFTFIWKELDLSDNILNHLDGWEFQGVWVFKLDIRSNTLTLLNERAFSGTKGIQFLDLSYNFLSYLPALVFRHLFMLKHLNLANNR